MRVYRIAAIAVDVTLNRYLDHDPNGRMYVLEQDLARVRDEERRNAEARAGRAEPAVSAGLQGDAIQPLVVRVHPGECLEVRLRNALADDEAASFHLHGSVLRLAEDGSAAVATNPRALAPAGRTVVYRWMVPADEPEGTHYFHSHGDTRRQSAHGLFGAVVVEPPGSRWLDPRTGAESVGGWDAVIDMPEGSDFREAALVYHEIGHENYQLLDAKDRLVPLVDPLLSAYRPASRALNYRSEPFLNRMRLQQERAGRFDESVAYSSYAFGDPATPLMRAYVGDPMKQRVVHGGSEVSHVHHVHGGSIRWRRQPGTEPTRFDTGLDKHPPLTPQTSERTDSQSIGPSETFDIADECGSGGCQASVGDFLYHCHVAQHYFAGMWGLWRVYNTLQDGRASTDRLPQLAELPDRSRRVAAAVPVRMLAGRTVDFHGTRSRVGDVVAWAERQLPPRGVPKGYDASVLDWRRSGLDVLGEPEETRPWPGYRSPAPGSRPPILFEPRSGRLAYPFLSPHLGRRPPFAPNHGPAPFLDTDGTPAGPGPPGASGRASVCPAGTRLKTFRINAVTLPITLNRRTNLVDPGGQIFVLREQEEAVLRDNRLRVPLAIRANAGEDCVDVILASELADTPESHHFSKVNAHIHFMQFDVQASDGVVAGFNYEQSVRPFTGAGERATSATSPGATRMRVTDTARFSPGAVVAVGLNRNRELETARIAAVAGDALTFAAPLRFAHPAGDVVSAEFVRYRWYPDVQFGTAYFHDHVNAIASWRHGLFGALIAEPPRSTYHDPRTGAPLSSGPVADIHTPSRVSADVTGSFREMVMFIQDDQPINSIGRSSGSALNLRTEPLGSRPGDPSMLFSSALHGDPETPLMEAYLGDPVVVRALVGATNDVHTWHVDGHWFRIEPWSATSPPVSTVHVGISERYDLVIPRAGGPQAKPGDYLYYSGRSFKLREGSWGILRVHEAGGSLQRLPGRAPVAPKPDVCPPGAPVRTFGVSAVAAKLPMLEGRDGAAFVLDGAGAPTAPLVLRANVGDCITVRLTNRLNGDAVSFHTDLLALDPLTDAGVAAGRNPPQAVPAGGTRTYRLYATPEIGETVALVRDWGNVLSGPGRGLYGAIVIGAAGTRYRDPRTGGPVGEGWAVDAVPGRGAPYRDFALFMQDDDAGIGTHRMPYVSKTEDTVGLNYRAESLAGRIDTPAGAFTARIPSTPVLEAYAGDAVRLHVLVPWSEQAQVFSVEGHRWPLEPGRSGTPLVSSMLVGGLEAVTHRLDGGAGGWEALPGDYLYGNHREPYREAGLWGLFRVRSRCGGGEVLRLPGSRCPGSGRLVGISAIAAIAGTAGVIFIRRRRNGRIGA